MGKIFVTPTPLLKIMSKLRVPIMVEMEDAMGDLSTFVMPLIRQRREELKAGAERKGDLLESLLDAQVKIASSFSLDWHLIHPPRYQQFSGSHIKAERSSPFFQHQKFGSPTVDDLLQICNRFIATVDHWSDQWKI
jgi:hypothetical protein